MGAAPILLINRSGFGTAFSVFIRLALRDSHYPHAEPIISAPFLRTVIYILFTVFNYFFDA